VNRYLEVKAPWKAIKAEGGREGTAVCLYHAAEALRFVGVLLHPIMPEKCAELLSRLGQDAEPKDADSALAWGSLEAGAPIRSGDPLFPRVELAD